MLHISAINILVAVLLLAASVTTLTTQTPKTAKKILILKIKMEFRSSGEASGHACHAGHE